MITETVFRNALKAELNIPNKYEFMPIIGVDKIGGVDNLVDYAWPAYRVEEADAIKNQIIEQEIIEKMAEKLAQFSRDYSFIISYQDGDIDENTEIPLPPTPPVVPVDCFWN